MELWGGLKKLALQKPEPSWGKATTTVPGLREKGQGVTDAADVDTWEQKWIKPWNKESVTCPGQQQEGTRESRAMAPPGIHLPPSWSRELCGGSSGGFGEWHSQIPTAPVKGTWRGHSLGLIWPI